jgi:hypothetical protein
MIWSYSTHGRSEKYTQNVNWKILREETKLEISALVWELFQMYFGGGKCGQKSCRSGCGPKAGFYEDGY